MVIVKELWHEMFEIEQADGRSFSRDFVPDNQGSILLNDKAIRAMGREAVAGNQLKL